MRYRRLVFILLIESVSSAAFVQGEDSAKPAVNDVGVDVAFLDITGQGEQNIFVTDVDNPESEPVQLTHNIGMEHFLELHPDGDTADANPAYQGVWRYRFDYAAGVYQLENLETGEIRTIAHCDPCGSVSISPDGRYILLELDETTLYDVEDGSLIPFFPQTSMLPVFWLDATLFLDWYRDAAEFFVYDIQTSQYYRLVDVLDRDSLEIDVSEAQAYTHPETSTASQPIYDDSLLPREANIFDAKDWSPDGTQIIYATSDFDSPEGQYCDGCAVRIFDTPTGESSDVLVARPGEKGGYRVTSLHWSPDGTRFVVGFYEIGTMHQPDEYWLVDLASRETYPLFSATGGVQWLR